MSKIVLKLKSKLDDKYKLKDRFKRLVALIRKYIIPVSIAVVLLAILLYPLIIELLDWFWSKFGDAQKAHEVTFEAYVSLIAFIGLVVGLLLQSRELSLQREELGLQREEIVKTNNVLGKQLFDNTFLTCSVCTTRLLMGWS